VNRALSERLHGIDEHRQVEKLATQADDPRGQMHDLLRAAEDQGLPVRPGANPPFVESPRPGSNAALNLALDCLADRTFGAVTVKFLAWFVHATPAGILSLSDKTNLRAGPDGQTTVPLIADASNVNLWLSFLGTILAHSQQAYLDYFGHVDPAWVQTRREFSLTAAAQRRA
jgi:hypothetical protein